MIINILNGFVPTIFFIVGFYFGFKIGFKSKQDINLPEIKSPKRIIKEHKEKLEAEEDLEETKKWIQEIDNYKGEFGVEDEG